MPRASAFEVDLRVETDKPAVALSPHLYGLFFEDINFSADGGLYAELIQNRSFEYSPRTKPEHTALFAWTKVERDGARASLAIAEAQPLNAQNPHYLEIAIATPGSAGVSNSGFDGVPLTAGARYDVALYARVVDESAPVALTVALELPDGSAAGALTFEGVGKAWRRFEGQLTATRDCRQSRLVVTTTGRGTLALDMVSLFPQDTWRGRKYGLRRDLVQALADLRPRFLRFPGGCIVHGHGVANFYRWKDTVGDIAERRPNWSRWGYHQSYGLGFFEYFQLCEDLGALALPVLPVGVSCGYTGLESVPMDELQPYIQDVLDLVEFANGPISSRWGAVRAKMGHPAPFNLSYVCLGNEEHDTPELRERFPRFVRALRAAHPEIKIIGTSGLTIDIPLYDLMDREQVHSSDEHYYEAPEWFLRNQHRFDHCDRAKPKVVVGEYASWDNRLFNALAEAAYLTGIERNGDLVDMAAYAPLLGRLGHTQWTPDLIYFDDARIVRTANYYVQQLFAQNKGDVSLTHTMSSSGTLPLASTRGQLGVGSTHAAVEIAAIVVDGHPVDLAACPDKAGRLPMIAGVRCQRDESLDSAMLLSPVPAEADDLGLRVRARKTAGAGGGLRIVFGASSDGGGGLVWSVGEGGPARHRLVDVVGKQPLVENDGPLLDGRWHDYAVTIEGGRIRCAVDGATVIDHRLAPQSIAVSTTLDRRTNELVLKLINPNEVPANIRIRLAGATELGYVGRLVTLSGDRNAQNSIEHPDVVVPATSEIAIAGAFEHELPAMSLHILRVPLGPTGN